ncbi:MAG: precorrin-6y C5,15-methyltransferase (decarboxylating) subunit CbiE [Thermodesulfobacteriota bacterium]|nr:precorrin-6y C5,15-methyltransferase (decarboxylating) subunit CbiE [Thermodesulfobacteriota bacterium]
MPIHVVGLGIDPDNLPEHSLGVIEHAQVLFGGKRFLDLFEDHPAEKILIASPLEPVLEKIAEKHAQGLMAVVLADGDPLFYGIGATLIERLGPEDVRVYPNVSTLQVAAAKLKIPWQDIACVSLHGRNDYGPLFSAITRSDWTAVFTDEKNIPSAIAQAVLDKGGEKFAVWVLEDLETDKENIRKLSLAEAGRTSFSKRNTVLLEKIAPPEVALGLGTPDNLFFHENGPFTKGPIRAAALAAMRITPDSTVWDLGSGCGAMAVEASSLTRGRIFAVEKNMDRVNAIRENIRRTGAYLVEAVYGTMPKCLDDLPDPDRIFIGGGMGRGGDVLAEACTRLKPGGRVVVNLVLLESLSRAKKIFTSMRWPFFITLVQASQSGELAGNIRFEALNPVFAMGADKPK